MIVGSAVRFTLPLELEQVGRHPGGVKRLYKREFLGLADVSGGPESGADRPTTTLG
jgi:hypothetical protein